ncbi:hypothetical protein HDV57DRAFT_126036 [Trichoderma longibrachiatum]
MDTLESYAGRIQCPMDLGEHSPMGTFVLGVCCIMSIWTCAVIHYEVDTSHARRLFVYITVIRPRPHANSVFSANSLGRTQKKRLVVGTQKALERILSDCCR